ncbi:MAG TPA: hypothetical protein VNV41_06255 [Candidatus Acidoferrales bacterium]|jgi:hypothetical protein|nr:hypothetical protein [Candidatus Acidoferrales bacterium]
MPYDPMLELLALLEKREANRNGVGGNIAEAVRIERDITIQCEAVLMSMVRPAVYTIVSLHRRVSTSFVSHSSTAPQTL